MAIKEMQDAEDKNQRQTFAAAKLKFDEADRKRKDSNEMLKQRFDRMLNLLSKNRNAALVEAKLIEGKMGDGLIAAQLRKGNYQKAYELFSKAIESQDKADAELAKQQTIFAQKVALKKTPGAARAGGGGSGKIQQLPSQLEKKLDEIGTTFVTLNRANQTRKPEYFGIAPSDEVANMIIAGVERGLPVGDIMRSVGSAAPKVTPDTVNWWKDYQAFVAQVRNKLFGATLTPREAEDFRKFTLSPATAPDVANNYFNNQISIIKSAIERERTKARSRGVTDETISAYLDVPQDQTGGPRIPTVDTQAEYDAVPPGGEYIDKQTGKRAKKPMR
jgi:tetratricopeptide (TPR) repeat protein